MKIYKVYVLDGEEIKRVDTFYHYGALNSYVQRDELLHDFVIVHSYTQKDSGLEPEEFKVAMVYLDGVLIKRYRHKVKVEDIDALKEKMTTVFHVNGKRTYYPNRPFDEPEVRDVVGGLFSMNVLSEEPPRWALLFYNTEQYEKEEKPYNEEASERFGRELYGDVLFINESFVS